MSQAATPDAKPPRPLPGSHRRQSFVAARLSRPILLAVAVLAATPAASAPPDSAANSAAVTARQLIARGEALMRGHTATGRYRMTIVTPDWERTLDMRFWEDVDADRAFVRVLAPPREAGSASLKLGDEMWTYLPSVERSMRIPPSMMAQSWMGSDFTNDDLVNGDDVVDQYDHSLVDTARVDDQAVYVIASVPHEDAPVVWGQIRSWVRVHDALPVRQVFYDEDGVEVRRMVLSAIQDVGGRTIPTRWEMVPLTEEREGHRTVIVLSDMVFDEPIPADTFTRRNLERQR